MDTRWYHRLNVRRKAFHRPYRKPEKARNEAQNSWSPLKQWKCYVTAPRSSTWCDKTVDSFPLTAQQLYLSSRNLRYSEQSCWDRGVNHGGLEASKKILGAYASLCLCKRGTKLYKNYLKNWLYYLDIDHWTLDYIILEELYETLGT